MHTQKTIHRYHAITPTMLQAWHATHYRLDNMAIIATGNVNPDDIATHANSIFQSVKQELSAPLQQPRPKLPRTPTEIVTRLAVPFWNQSKVTVGAWNHGSVKGEKAIIDVAVDYLKAKSFDLLRLKHGLAYGCWAYFHPKKECSFLVLGATVKRGNERQAEQLLKHVLDDVKTNDIPADELNGLKTKMLADYARKNANPSWYNMELTRGAFDSSTIDMDDYPSQLRDVTAEQIRDVLKRLTEEHEPLVIRQIPLLSVATTVCLVVGIIIGILALILWIILR